jgi:hypothetical protein
MRCFPLTPECTAITVMPIYFNSRQSKLIPLILMSLLEVNAVILAALIKISFRHILNISLLVMKYSFFSAGVSRFCSCCHCLALVSFFLNRWRSQVFVASWRNNYVPPLHFYSSITSLSERYSPHLRRKKSLSELKYSPLFHARRT